MGEAQLENYENEDRLLKEADHLAGKNEWRKAALLLGNAGSTNLLSTKARGAQAFYFSRAGDYEKAIILLKDLCQIEPTVAQWPFNLGFQFQQNGQWDASIASYEYALKLAPKWIKIHLSLGRAHEETRQADKALSTYRAARRVYKELPHESRQKAAKSYGLICKQIANLLLSKNPRQNQEVAEALDCLYEGAEAVPNDLNSWYRLGGLLLDIGRLDEALQHLTRAEKLGPRNEYVCHKIAQVYLKKGDADEALRRYGSIQPHKQVPYILRGIAQCLLAKGQALEAAKKLHQAIRREPDKFFHYKDFALALIELQASDQAMEALEKTNSLYEKEHGKPYKWAIDKINAIRSTPLSSSERIYFDQDPSSVSTISFGAVTKFNDDRGFGFIQDRSDHVTVFFHISRVKDRVTPQTGAKVRYVREAGQKGPQASRVWLLKD